MSDIKSLEDIFNDDDLGLLDDGKEKIAIKLENSVLDIVKQYFNKK